MTDDRFYAPDHRIAPPVSQPAESIWCLRKGVETIVCELRVQGIYGVDVQVIRDGTFAYSQRFNTRVLADQFAALERQALERDGWR